MSNNEGEEESPSSSPPATSMEESIKEIRQKIRERQAITQETYQKFVTLANEESDPFKKDIAEALAAIQFTTNSTWLEIERLYTIELVNTEKIKQLYRFIFTLPEVIEDKEVTNRMLEKHDKLRNRIKSLQEEMR